ncbi:MAG: V-type ATP synthase subunit D [Bacteroidales bacterium]|nr:V-type ATP synthase subunit D [Bacteroidales bacterium]
MIKFQYNKTSLQQLEKQLNMRMRILPTIKNKESALRMEVKHSRDEINRLDLLLEQQINNYDDISALWNEFDTSLLNVKDVELNVRKIAGVRIPVLEKVEFEIHPYSIFNNPKWYWDGIILLQELAETGIRKEFAQRKLDLLEYARKKTTQKVNLFEKVQIPGYEDAVRKIKRFMEDEENLSKSSQKIMKTLQGRKEKIREESL